MGLFSKGGFFEKLGKGVLNVGKSILKNGSNVVSTVYHDVMGTTKEAVHSVGDIGKTVVQTPQKLISVGGETVQSLGKDVTKITGDISSALSSPIVWIAVAIGGIVFFTIMRK